MTIRDRLNATFQTVFDDPDIEIRPEMVAGDIDGWDSLSHVNLILAVEREFGIRFTTGELLAFRNIGDLLRAVELKSGAPGAAE